MGMSVNFIAASNVGKVNNLKSEKNSNLGAKIGATAGSVLIAANMYKSKSLIKTIYREMPKPASIGTIAFGVAGALAIATGLGALAEKGIKKASAYLKNRKNVDGKPVDPSAPNTVKTKEGEFVVEKGHPKKIYKKTADGKLEFVTEVYDGSWGKESSDEDLIKVITTPIDKNNVLK